MRSWGTRVHQTQAGFQALLQGVGGFSAQKPGEHEYIKNNRVKLKFCMFCLTESTAQADNQGNMQGKISIEDFLGLE